MNNGCVGTPVWLICSKAAPLIWREIVAACVDQHIKSYNMKKRTFRVLRKLYHRHHRNHDPSIHSLAESYTCPEMHLILTKQLSWGFLIFRYCYFLIFTWVKLTSHHLFRVLKEELTWKVLYMSCMALDCKHVFCINCRSEIWFPWI